MHLFRSSWAIVLSALIAPPSPAAALPDWTLEVDTLQAGELVIEGMSARSDPGENQAPRVGLTARAIRTGLTDTRLGPFSLTCAGDVFAALESMCREGRWTLKTPQGWPGLEGTLLELSVRDTQTRVRLDGRLNGTDWRADGEVFDEGLRLSIELPEQALSGSAYLKQLLPEMSWASAGTVRGTARFEQTAGVPSEAIADLSVSGLEFDSPDGLFAGLGLDVSLSARSSPVESGVVSLEGRLVSGELLVGDFYRDFSGAGLDLTADAVHDNGTLDIQRFTVSDGGSLRVAGKARLPLEDDDASNSLALRELHLEFPEAYTRYLEPVAAVFSLDGLQTAGTVNWNGDWSGDKSDATARSGVLTFENVDIRDEKRTRFSISGLEGTVRTGADSRLSWGAARFERFDLGAGEARIALSTESISLREPLQIPVFGGTLSLDQLLAGFPGKDEPDFQVQATLKEIDMAQMSTALGWPEFGGTLGGRIPAVSISDGVINIDGALDFQVFDGDIVVTDLQVERPFGVLPSVAANITASNLDLEQLTRTFEFGRIGGRIEGYVRELRLLNWEPVQFDAWFGTPEDAGRQGISRRAITHLATIGGGSPTALLSGPVLRLFNDFSYRRLGLGCTLRDNVCHIRGIEQQGDAVLLLEGAGIPKVNILAYNRAVDWPQLVAEVSAVSGGQDVRIGE